MNLLQEIKLTDNHRYKTGEQQDDGNRWKYHFFSIHKNSPPIYMMRKFVSELADYRSSFAGYHTCERPLRMLPLAVRQIQNSYRSSGQSTILHFKQSLTSFGHLSFRPFLLFPSPAILLSLIIFFFCVIIVFAAFLFLGNNHVVTQCLRTW
jgi:hypothetical protein